ncbi:hypothetical protein EON63_22495 [archaeon]|nr:MAG: hypothetical protein EON63_22495 [archaeon]
MGYVVKVWKKRLKGNNTDIDSYHNCRHTHIQIFIHISICKRSVLKRSIHAYHQPDPYQFLAPTPLNEQDTGVHVVSPDRMVQRIPAAQILHIDGCIEIQQKPGEIDTGLWRIFYFD